MSFKKDRYVVIRGAVSKEVCDMAYTYLNISAEADYWLLNNNITYEGNLFIGNFKDRQVPNSYAKYADRLMETLLVKTIPVMEKNTGLKLIPTYSYCRIYRRGNILYRHKDRPSCEISTTLNLGGDPWPIFIDPTGSNNIVSGSETTTIVKPNAPKGKKVLLHHGDMLIYSGCELEHWREKFTGNICCQVFLHYNHLNGKFADSNLFDKRKLLGIPK